MPFASVGARLALPIYPVPRETHANVVAPGSSRAGRLLSHTIAPQSISTTEDHFILVELTPDDLVPENRFDLEHQTVVFTPDGRGRYSRTVKPLGQDGLFSNSGVPVQDGALVEIESFGFDFADQRWHSFYVSRDGALSFGEPVTMSRDGSYTMRELAAHTFHMPAISPRYRPSDERMTMRIGQSPSKVTVTWSGRGQHFSVDLLADNGIAFHYGASLDEQKIGFSGLVLNPEIKKGNPIARLSDATDRDVFGAVDILEVTVYETNWADYFVVEFTVRDDITDPPEGESYVYSLAFDVDEPYSHDFDHQWQVSRLSDGEWEGGADGQIATVLSGGAANKVGLLVNPDSVAAATGEPRIVRGMAHAWSWSSNDQSRDDSQMVLVELDTGDGGIFASADLSEPEAAFSDRHTEVFHASDLRTGTYNIACMLVKALGDTFDALTFYSDELLLDRPMLPAGIYVGRHGTGTLCESDRLRGAWAFVNPTYYLPGATSGFNTFMFSHELSHIWGAQASYLNAAGEKIALNDSANHWPDMLHTAAAFVPSASSVLFGTHWQEMNDGRFQAMHGGYGHSWLDLYTMGLASADEVADVLIVRDAAGGEKDVVTIDQIIAADGPIGPAMSRTLNVGFVYLVRPGRNPDAAELAALAAYRDANVRFWHESTGGRSTLTSIVPEGMPNGDND